MISIRNREKRKSFFFGGKLHFRFTFDKRIKSFCELNRRRDTNSCCVQRFLQQTVTNREKKCVAEFSALIRKFAFNNVMRTSDFVSNRLKTNFSQDSNKKIFLFSWKKPVFHERRRSLFQRNRIHKELCNLKRVADNFFRRFSPNPSIAPLKGKRMSS